MVTKQTRRGLKVTALFETATIVAGCDIRSLGLVSILNLQLKVDFSSRKMARKTCTPFCDNKKTCPKHHDLLLTLINCSDRKNQEANACFEEYQSTVKAYLKKGWNVNDAIPDPVRNYRFPLLHWAGVMGKTRALEWMINFGR